MEVLLRLLKKHDHFVFLLPWLCHKSNGSLRATLPILLVQLIRVGECFYFWYNTRDGELRWRLINSIFSPSPMGKEKLVGIRSLGLFVLKDSKEMFLKNSHCLEYGFSLWRGHTNWNTCIIFKGVTEIKDLKKILWLALVGYVSRFKRTGWPWGTIPPWSIGFSLVKWIRSPSTLNHSPTTLYNLKRKFLFLLGRGGRQEKKI